MSSTVEHCWPVFARWRQSVPGGHATWYLAALRADRSFWGYVHFRTESCSENRSFGGDLDVDRFERIRSLIEIVVQSGKFGQPVAGVIDGLGTRRSAPTSRWYGAGLPGANDVDSRLSAALTAFFQELQEASALNACE